MPDNLQVLPAVMLSVHWLIVIGLSLRVIARRLPIGVALAWLTVAFALPFAGVVLYLIFGGKRLDGKRLKRQAIYQKQAESVVAAYREAAVSGAPPVGTPGIPIYLQALTCMGVPALRGNSMILFRDYESVFDAWINDIDNARENCRLAFYIWNDGGRADDVAAALLRARDRGVRCRVLADAVGSKAFLEGKGVQTLLSAGVEVVSALPPSLRRRADLRYHRKIMVIDDRVGYTGSQNLVDPRFFKQEVGVGPWVDAVARVEGPAVTLLADIFELDWSIETGTVFTPPKRRSDKSPEAVNDRTLVQVIPSGPTAYPDAIRRLLLTAIYSARRTLTLTTPYFVPDEAVLTALISVAQSGVAVTLIVPEKNDSFLVRRASEACFDDLIAVGARIALFQGGLLHTKSMVIDSAVSVFGSVNLDMRSFWLDFEDSLFVYGTEFSNRISELQQFYLSRSVFLEAEKWRKRPARRRFMENTIRLAGPLL